MMLRFTSVLSRGLKAPLQITLIYFITGALWILLSDYLLITVARDLEVVKQGQMLKGWAFIALTAILLYYLINSNLKKIKESETRFRTLAENLPVIVTRYDKEMHCLYINQQGSELMNIIPDEAVGKSLPQLINEKDVTDLWENAIGEVFKTGKPYYSEYSLHGRQYDWRLSPELNSQNDVLSVIGVSIDITERRRNERHLEKSLKEKEVLLKEVHHRVKNNLQIITSLLSLQSDYITDSNSKVLFIESMTRVKSMALIHERLYQNFNLSEIDFSDYLSGLINFLFFTYCVDSNKITLELDVENISLTVEQAIPCGLIANELVSNSLKYAFPNGQEGKITVRFRRTDARNLELLISDNGSGVPESTDMEKMKSLGLMLVDNLVKQMNGTLEFSGLNGFSSLISIPFTSHGESSIRQEKLTG